MVTDDPVSSQYDLDGQLGCVIEIERPRDAAAAPASRAANYCAFRGMLMKSYIYFEGKAEIALGKTSEGPAGTR